MIESETIGVFFLASVLLGIAPGPDNIFVLTQSALHGRLAGVVVTLGLCTGLLLHTSAVALGVAAVFQASTLAFNLLKLVGAAYLLFLAWKAFNAGSRDLACNGVAVADAWRLYRRGIVMNITNPKVSVFFLAFLPQFVNPANGAISLQLVFLGLVFIVATLLVFGSISFLAGSIGIWLNGSARSQQLLNRLAGTVFAVLAIKLAMAQR